MGTGQDTFNCQDWEVLYRPKFGQPMFETRLMVDVRVAVAVRTAVQ
jgi:hypothetical protein